MHVRRTETDAYELAPNQKRKDLRQRERGLDVHPRHLAERLTQHAKRRMKERRIDSTRLHQRSVCAITSRSGRVITVYPTPAPPPETEAVRLPPDAVIARVIGKKGAHVRAISRATTVKLSIDAEQRIARLRGPANQIAHAKRMLAQLLERAGARRDEGPERSG